MLCAFVYYIISISIYIFIERLPVFRILLIVYTGVDRMRFMSVSMQWETG